jgi:hypothetical protein
MLTSPLVPTTNELLHYALIGLEQQKKNLDLKIAEIRQQMDPTPSTPVKTAAPSTGRRTMSPEARARISAAQRKRWAASKKGATTAAVKAPTAKATKKRRTLSPEARARIAAAQRKRWAAVRKSA